MKNKKENPASNPNEADWCRVRETLLMLNLAVAQISGAMKDGDDSVNVLTDSFTGMMDHIQVMEEAADRLMPGAEQSTIKENCQQVGGQMQEAVVAFQFYDKLSQRLNHLSNSLASFAELMASPALMHDPDAWHLLQEEIKSRYTIETDKAMFDAILDGKSVAEALHQLKTKTQEKMADDIELF